MSHEQIFVKVNAIVDRGIAPLVSALNEIPGLITVESCEGNIDQEAYVSFRVGDDWCDLVKFVHNLSVNLGKNGQLENAWYSLSVEWCAGGINPLAYLRIPRQCIGLISEIIAGAACP